MRGPFSLTDQTVLRRVRQNRIGVYLLSNSRDGVVRYVGRSDSDVQGRLLKRVGEYSFFNDEYKSDPVETFLREYGLYHYYIDTVDNKIHPQNVPQAAETLARDAASTTE